MSLKRHTINTELGPVELVLERTHPVHGELYIIAERCHNNHEYWKRLEDTGKLEHIDVKITELSALRGWRFITHEGDHHG